MIRIAGALAVFALAATPGLAATPFRIAVASGKTETCAPPRGGAEAAYFAHLAKRLETEVLECPVQDMAQAGQMLAGGQADLALLDPASYAPVQGKTRAILTLREDGALNRVPAVFVVKAGSARTTANLKGARAVFGGGQRASLEMPKQVILDHLGPDYFSQELVERDSDDAIAALRAGKADVAVLHGGAWFKLCRGASPKAKPCADLKMVWRARTRAPQALAVRTDMPTAMRYRLIGIHMPLQLEAPEAFRWAARFSSRPGSFEPAEPDALGAAGAGR